MSQALQRVVVRMMVDPAFAAEVHAGLALPELNTAERGHLARVDPRAFHTDPYRRSRLLQACLEELPVAVALLTRGGHDLPAADTFFSSRDFHSCVQQRGVLTLAMGAWLERKVGAVARLELAVAKARRRKHPFGDGLCLGPNLWPLALPEGALARWQEVRQALGPDPVKTLVSTRVSLPSSWTHAINATPDDDNNEHMVVRVDTSGNAGLEGSSEGVDAVLRAALEPVPRETLEALVVAEGAPAEVATEIVDELVSDGLLVEALPP